MSVLTDLVDEVATVKSDIKVAIKNKGVSVTDDVPFTEYASKIDQIQGTLNPQNKTVYNGGIVTYDTGDKIFYGYDTTNVWPSEFHGVGETVWVESIATPHSNYIAFDSKIINDNQIVPDFTKPIAVVLDVTEWMSIYLNIYAMNSGSYIPKNGLSFTVQNNYDGLASVNVDYINMKALGVGAGSVLNISVPVVYRYAFTGDSSVNTVVCSSIDIGNNAFTEMQNLNSITLTNYKGCIPIVDSYTGQIYFTNPYIQIIGSDVLNSINVPELVIASANFASNCYNRNGNFVFNAPKLEGILSGTFIGNSWSGYAKDKPYNILKNNNIDFILFKYLGDNTGNIIYDYVNDVDNNITDTLTFPNLEYIGQNSFKNDYGTFSEITTLNLPNLKSISDYARLNEYNVFNITSLDLPKIEYIGNKAFGNNNGITTFNISNTCKYIASEAFSDVQNAIINIDLPEPTQEEIQQGSWKANAPWDAKNTTVNWTGIATQTTLHKYDRVDNKATVVDFFTDSNDQRYALCVVDAAYRSTKGYSYSVNGYTPSSLVGLTDYNAALSDTNSGSWYMNIFDEEEAGGYPMANFPAFKFAKNACLVTVDGNTYTGVVPTVNELLAIREDKATLDTYDPTLLDYTSNSLSNWSFGSSKGYVRTCMLTGDKSGSIVLSMDSYQDQYSITSDVTGVCPVIEIPVDANGTVISN